jgi:cell shape-determining protein MreC
MQKAPAESLVQELLAETRRLKVENERLKLDLRELQKGAGRPDPRLRQLESENQRLREELAAARALRDALQEGVSEALDKLSRI